METYTGVVFRMDWLRSQVFDNGDSEKAHAFRGSTNFSTAVQDVKSKQDGRPGKLQNETLGVISWVMTHLSSVVRINICQGYYKCFMTRKDRKNKAMAERKLD